MTGNKRARIADNKEISRRDVLASGVEGIATLLTGGLAKGETPARSFANEQVPLMGTNRLPGAFVYIEVQVSMPFNEFTWEARNHALKQTPGLLGRTWLSGLNTQTPGGFDVFDTVENARRFAIESFPDTVKKLNAAFMTRVFSADTTEAASRAMHSTFYPEG